MLSWLLLALVAGSLVYCVLTIVAAVRYRGVGRRRCAQHPPISILKPLAGIDDGLEENLRTFFEQEYPDFEILFAVRSANDPAIAVAERLRARLSRRVPRASSSPESRRIPTPKSTAWTVCSRRPATICW